MALLGFFCIKQDMEARGRRQSEGVENAVPVALQESKEKRFYKEMME